MTVIIKTDDDEKEVNIDNLFDNIITMTLTKRRVRVIKFYRIACTLNFTQVQNYWLISFFTFRYSVNSSFMRTVLKD